jgi:hypothetical protein
MMLRTVVALSVGAALTFPGSARPETNALETLFPSQAPLAIEGEGLTRLLLPPAVLAECRPDLSDVRIVDGEGREVPYLVDSGRPAETALELSESFVPQVREVGRGTVERDEAPDLQRESYSLTVPSTPPTGGGWELVVTPRRQHFVRRVTVSQGAKVLLAGASLFRLPQPDVAKTRLTLPRLTTEDLVIELEGEEGFFLEPTFRFESARALAGGEQVRVELSLLELEHVDDHSQLVVERPAGLTPDVLELGASTPAFSRRLTVWDDGAGSVAAAVGSGTLYRVDAAAGVERLELKLGAVRGDRLRVVIQNGDSPPLEDATLTAVIRQPALIFSGSPSSRLLFGGARAHRPRYDLAALRPRLPASGEAASVGERLYDPAQLASARLGVIAPNPAFDSTPALSFAMRAGGALDARRYTHRQDLSAEPSTEGLVRVDLDLELLAAARPDLGDLRIVDGQGRQRAYLLERRGTVRTRALDLRGVETRDRVSEYAIELPVRPAVLDELVLHTAAPYFDRPFQLEAELADGTSRVIAGGRLARLRGDPRPVRIPVGGERIQSLRLSVPDGDDAPLELARAEGRFTVPQLYFAAPAGAYSVLAGSPDDSAPVYELARVRDVVLAVAAGSAELEPVARNPDYSAGARLASGRGLQAAFLWSAIGLVVAVLAWIALRMARQESA